MYEKAGERTYIVDLLGSDEKQLEKITKERNLGLSVDEMKNIKDYFIREGRNPYDVELEAFAQSWSEHCCYKSSKNILKDTIFNVKSEAVICAISEDAAVVDFEGEYAYVVKIESHNHPSALDPYGGAATGVGGVLRDIVCMGSQPIALVDSIFFGPLNMANEDLPAGTKHPRYLYHGVVSGIADYGNRVGIPTISGMTVFDESYTSNCLVNAGSIGIIKKENIIRSRVGQSGDLYIVAGGKTGKDGIHGVTFASQELSEESEESDRAAVQLGYAIMKEPLIHATLEANEKKLLTGLKDFGGGGLSCVSAEMAHAAGYGATIYLDKIPLKEPDISPWEIWVSESQERMMMSVKKEDAQKVLDIFKFWDVPAEIVGEIDATKRIKVMYKDLKVMDVDLDFLLTGACYSRPIKIVEKPDTENNYEMGDNIEFGYNIVGMPNIGSKEAVIRRYDHEVRQATVIKPMQGAVEQQTHGDAAVLKPLKDSFKGLSVTCDVNPRLCRESPYWGSASAVDEAIRNLTAVNSKPHSIVDCLNFANPEKPERLGDFKQSVQGLYDIAQSCDIPFVSGNVSLYNEGASGPIAPTPSLMTIGIAKDIRKCVTSDLKESGNKIILVGETKDELRGSAYHELRKANCGKIPKVNAKKTWSASEKIRETMDEGKIKSCHDLSEGGLFVALSEMSFGSGGLTVEANIESELRDDITLFSESNGRWLIEVKADDAEFIAKKLDAQIIGEVVKSQEMKINGYSWDMSKLHMNWCNAVEAEVPK